MLQIFFELEFTDDKSSISKWLHVSISALVHRDYLPSRNQYFAPVKDLMHSSK